MNESRAEILPNGVTIEGNIPPDDVIGFMREMLRYHPDLKNPATKNGQFAKKLKQVGTAVVQRRQNLPANEGGLCPKDVTIGPDDVIRAEFFHDRMSAHSAMVQGHRRVLMGFLAGVR